MFFCLFFYQGSAASQLFHNSFFLIFIFIYLAEIPLQGPRYQLGENNFLFLFQHIPSYFFIVFNFLLLNSYRSCFWSNFFPKVQMPVSYFIKLKVCTDLWYSSHCRQQGQSESTGSRAAGSVHNFSNDFLLQFVLYSKETEKKFVF